MNPGIVTLEYACAIYGEKAVMERPGHSVFSDSYLLFFGHVTLLNLNLQSSVLLFRISFLKFTFANCKQSILKFIMLTEAYRA